MTNKEMLAKIMEKLDSMDSRITALESKKTPTSKKTSTKKTDKPQTKKEAIDAWCEKKGYTEADRKAYGEAKQAERNIKKQAYEMTNKQFDKKVPYKTWREAYEANLKKLSK